MNFKVIEGKLIALTLEAYKLMKCPTERVEFVSNEIIWDVAPYDAKLQTYDLSSYKLLSLEEEYLNFLHGL